MFIIMLLNLSWASLNCTTECEQASLRFNSLATRQAEFSLCMKLCQMEVDNPSQSTSRDNSSNDNFNSTNSIFNFGDLEEDETEKSLPDSAPTVRSSQKRISSPTTDSNIDNSSKSIENTSEEDLYSNSSSCYEDYTTEISQCEQAKERAQRGCDEEGSALATVNNLASQTSILAGKATTSGIYDSCAKMGDYAKKANAAVFLYRQVCNASVAACGASCASIKPKCRESSDKFLRAQSRVSEFNNTCRQYQAKLSEANNALDNFAQLEMSASQCAMLSSGDPAEFCLKNPTNMLCANFSMSCESPEMATNKVCVCAKDPSNPICQPDLRSSSANSVVEYKNLNSSDHRLQKESAQLGSTDLPTKPKISVEESRSSFDSALDGQQSSPNTGVRQIASNSNTPQEREKRMRKKNSKDVLGGFYSFGQKEKIAEDGVPPREEKANSGGKSKLPTTQTPDLSQFLPNVRRKAGQANGANQIAGPHTNIFKQINIRYRSLTETLNP